MVIDGIEIQDENKSIYEYKGRNFKEFDIRDWLQFAKANKEVREPGISYDELRALHEALESMGHNPLTIFETGMCFGTTTRYFLIRKLKYGGELYSCEYKVRDLFKKIMQELDLWKEINVVEGNSMKVNWNKEIDVLFIDSEHALSDALGEYMRYRVFLKPGAIVGFHDTDYCYGVARAIQIITNELDELIPISSSTKVSGAGIKLFRLGALNVIQNRVNTEMKKRQKEWQ